MDVHPNTKYKYLNDKKEKKDDKSDKAFIPHLDLVDGLKPTVKEIFVIPENKNITFSAISNYADYIEANLFDGNRLIKSLDN